MSQLNNWKPIIIHHGSLHGVTGSCHELVYSHQGQQQKSILIDCGLFQGDDHSSHGLSSASADNLLIDFDLSKVRSLCVTHAHIDHIGRIPYLIMAGFNKPIYCSEATAMMIPIMLEDAIKLGLTRDKKLVSRLLQKITDLIIPVAYKQWAQLDESLKVKFKQAGHILGSAYLEFDISKSGVMQKNHRVVFSGDLGAPYAALLAAPKSPYRCDTLVIESTYGNRLHEGRKERKQQLKNIVENCLKNRGVVLIPAFSLGRTQSILYEFEQIINQYGNDWEDIEIVVDSPMANRLTTVYRKLSNLWDKEAKRKMTAGRHPLNFDQMTVIDDSKTHVDVVDYLKKTARPTIVIAASGMCTGGRIVNYLKALVEDPRTDVLFSGYQAIGSTGWQIQKYGNKSKYSSGWVELEGKRFNINAGVYSLSGYSAHADQKDLINFVKRIRIKPSDIRLVHGDERAKKELLELMQAEFPDAEVLISNNR